MPLYEFDCTDCGEAFEKRVRLSDTLDSIACPHCGGIKTQKKLSQFAVKGGSSTTSTSSASSCSTGGT